MSPYVSTQATYEPAQLKCQLSVGYEDAMQRIASISMFLTLMQVK